MFEYENVKPSLYTFQPKNVGKFIAMNFGVEI
jgi:hypothetical protein